MTTVQAQISLNEACIKAMAYDPHLEISPEHDAFDAVLNMITGYSKIQVVHSFMEGRGITLSNILSHIQDSILNEATTHYAIALKEEWPNELQPL